MNAPDIPSENPDAGAAHSGTVLAYSGTPAPTPAGSMAVLTTIARNYPARTTELHRLSVSYRRDPTTARPYIMALEALVAVALRAETFTLAPTL